MITIRPVRIDEIVKLQELNQEVFLDNQQYDDDLIMDWALSEKGKTYFTELVNNPHAICFVAEENKMLVGYIAANKKDFGYRKSTYLEIENMGVNPSHRSQGVGTKLIQTCLAWAKEHGFTKAYVNAYSHNKKAIAFYQENGFAEVDVSLEREI